MRMRSRNNRRRRRLGDGDDANRIPGLELIKGDCAGWWERVFWPWPWIQFGHWGDCTLAGQFLGRWRRGRDIASHETAQGEREDGSPPVGKPHQDPGLTYPAVWPPQAHAAAVTFDGGKQHCRCSLTAWRSSCGRQVIFLIIIINPESLCSRCARRLIDIFAAGDRSECWSSSPTWRTWQREKRGRGRTEAGRRGHGRRPNPFLTRHSDRS